MTYFTKTARRAGLAAVAAMMLTSAPALGEANEYFKCTLKEGVETEALVTLGKDFVAQAAKNGHADFSVAFLFPVFAADISRGSFFWQGTAPNIAGIGAINDYWEDSDANADIRKRWGELLVGCESSSVFVVMRPE